MTHNDELRKKLVREKCPNCGCKIHIDITKELKQVARECVEIPNDLRVTAELTKKISGWDWKMYQQACLEVAETIKQQFNLEG